MLTKKKFPAKSFVGVKKPIDEITLVPAKKVITLTDEMLIKILWEV